MHERMLDKNTKPTDMDFMNYCGQCKTFFEEIDEFLLNELYVERLLRFPYGKNYGWGMKYTYKRKHICDIFAERDSFTVMIRMTNEQFELLYETLTDEGRNLVDNKYPCSDGGWIHYRVTTKEHVRDINALLQSKVSR